MCETIFVTYEEYENDTYLYRWSPTEDISDILDGPHIIVDEYKNEIVYITNNTYRDSCGDEQFKEVIYKKLEDALKRLMRESKLIHEFEQSIQTEEQKLLKFYELLLEHNGKKIVVTNEDCFGFHYNAKSKVCNPHCGLMTNCIEKKKEFKQRIEAAFDKDTAKAILRDIAKQSKIGK